MLCSNAVQVWISVSNMILWQIVVFMNVALLFTKTEILIDNDGGYKNIIVGISPGLQESNVEYYLLQLESLFKNASGSLLTASKEKVFFKEIVFAIPKKYKDWISRSRLESCPMCFKSPDIFLTENDVYLNPYTIQNRGCGKPGLRIHIPKEFLGSSSDTDKAIHLVRQWAHYRYGVFDESGFSNDELYPVCYKTPGADVTKVSDCTNDEVVYNFNKGSDYSDPGSDTCTPVPQKGQNDHIESSIMSNFAYPKVKYFCDTENQPHNKNAPTKQNALCKEQSVWEVISKHQDLKLKRKNSSSPRLPFKYILESDPRLVIAVDSSKDMELNDRMDLVRNAFAHFLFYSLPPNSTVGLMNMKDTMANPVLSSIQTQEDAERMLNAFPDAYGESDICVYCTIQRILEVLKLEVSDIIMVTGTDITGTGSEKATTMLKSRKVALHVIYFQQNQTEPAFLEEVARSSGGAFHYIAETFPPGSFVSSLNLLYEAFRSVYESFSWMNRNHVLIDQKTFTDDCSPKCVLSFPSDRTIKNLQVIITGPNFGGSSPPVLKDTIRLYNGEELFGPSNMSFTYKSQIPAFMFTIENPEPRLWNLTFNRRPGNNKPIVVVVRGTNDNYKDILHMRSWISFDDEQNVDASTGLPITIFSQINKDNNPVFGAQVQAFIHQMSYNDLTSLELQDNGNGGPDITKHDGIFTRWLTDIKKEGYHSITTVAERWSSQYLYRTRNAKGKELHCCGSFIPTSLAYNSGPFKRITTHQSFFVKSKYANQNYPPIRITDLRVEKIDILKYNIRCYLLKWTAPGENGDKGTASEYDIRVFDSRDDAQNNFENNFVLAIKMLNIHGPLLMPQEAGTIQTACVQITNLTTGIYFIGMKTISHANKISDISNLVEILYTDPTTSSTGSSRNPYITSPDEVTTKTISGNDTALPLSSATGLAIGLSCGILLILIIVGVIIFIYCERKRQSNKTNPPSGYHNKKTESNDALCNGGGGSLSIISPVTSWGADSLITHSETLNKDKSTEKGDLATMKPNKESDSVSFSSSKYSYDNKIDQYSLHDPIYYNNMHSQEELNYPYNPVYIPFNPSHTSSLRRYNDCDALGIPDPSENASFYNYNPNIGFPSRLRTDV